MPIAISSEHNDLADSVRYWSRGSRHRTFCMRRWNPRSLTRRRTGRPPPSRACKASTSPNPLADRASGSSNSRS